MSSLFDPIHRHLELLVGREARIIEYQRIIGLAQGAHFAM
jgi:hypothetical protein